MRLDYEDTKFDPDKDEALYAIRFTTNETSNIKIPYSPDFDTTGVDTGKPPFTGNGFTKAENGQLIPEYKCSDARVTPNDGAQIIKIGKDGFTEVVAVYDENEKNLSQLKNN